MIEIHSDNLENPEELLEDNPSEAASDSTNKDNIKHLQAIQEKL